VREIAIPSMMLRHEWAQRCITSKTVDVLQCQIPGVQEKGAVAALDGGHEDV
jgi:hypothetical protein